LTLFQVGQLWFVNFTNRNFFLYVQARFAPSPPDWQQVFIRPYRIIYGAGDGRFNMQHSGIGDSPLWAYGESVLAAVLRNGDFAGVRNINTEQLLSRPAIIYKYAFNMQTNIFSQILGQRRGGALSGHNLNSFNSIIIQPPTYDNQNLHVFFLDNTRAWEFRLSPTRGRDSADSFIREIATVSNNQIYFRSVSSYSLGFAPFAPYGMGYFLYPIVTVTNPYQNPSGGLTMVFIRSRIEPFFDNPATINHGTGTIYTFSNANTIVRYLEGNVLEYRSFRPIGRTTPASFIADFSAAWTFIDNDLEVRNEVFLSHYETRGREHVFLFNYVIGNFPLVLTEPHLTMADCTDPLQAAIEVVVDHGRVIRYRRLAYNFHLGTEFGSLDFSTINAETPIVLGFPIQTTGNTLSLEPV